MFLIGDAEPELVFRYHVNRGSRVNSRKRASGPQLLFETADRRVISINSCFRGIAPFGGGVGA